MTTSQLYYNPRCSKCREALALLQAHGVEPQLIAYLDQAPSIAGITTLLRQLGLTDARKLMRQGEPEYAALDLANPALAQPELIAAMAANPKLIERPIFIRGDKAVIGRPPERVLELL